MIRFLTPVLGVFMLVGLVGCNKDSNTDPKMMSEVDVCPSCKGLQKATVDGKCEGCKATLTDACSHCSGVQVPNAEGKCPMCGAKTYVK